MPPKVDAGGKLDQLRRYVTSNVRQLASRGATSLKEIFGAQSNSEEASFYRFLWSYQNTFTDVQRAHADETLALLTPNSGDGHHAVAPGMGAEHGGGQPTAPKRSAKSSGVGQPHQPKPTAESSCIGQPAASKPVDAAEHSDETPHPQVTETGDPVSVGEHHADDGSEHFDFHAFDQRCHVIAANCN